MYLTYLGNILDEGTEDEMRAARVILVGKIMGNELPDFLTSEDFDGFDDCFDSFKVEAMEDMVI